MELDIFSGMPNPTWTLTNGEVDRFTQQLGVLPPSAARELSGNLGYRWLIVQCTRGTKKQSIRTQRGIVQISRDERTVYMTDQGRELERQLLNIGKRHLNLDILQIVEREIR